MTRRQWSVFAAQLTVLAVVVVVVVVLVRALLLQTFVIPSRSMESTLEPGDRIAALKVGGFQRGDLVVFTDPGGWLEKAPQAPRPGDRVRELLGIDSGSTPGYLVKRVIGMPGDVVVCCDAQGRVTVNGQPLDESGYLFTNADGSTAKPSTTAFEVVVPAGRLFVMGDNRDQSSDSRCHLFDDAATRPLGWNAFVPAELVVGTPVAIVSPFSRVRALERPATFAAVPEPTRAPPAEATIAQTGVTC